MAEFPRYIRLEMFTEHGDAARLARVYLPKELGQTLDPWGIVAADVAVMCQQVIEKMKE